MSGAGHRSQELDNMHTRSRTIAGVAAGIVLSLATAMDAAAAPCAGFNDVDDTSQFCANVEWLKNRAITLGCTPATNYCPNEPVIRLAMAAFMNRLGTALTPVQLRVDAATGAIDLDVNAVVCQTTDFAVTGFPRRAYVDVNLAATGPADVDLAADLVFSADGGANWTNLNTVTSRGSLTANHWTSLADLGTADFAVGQTVRLGVRMTRGGAAGSADVSDSRCQMRALLHSRTGASSPL